MGNENPNPNHQEALNLIPQEFHNLLIPVFKKWDQGVQQKLEETRSQFEPYKALIDSKIDPKFVTNAVTLAEQLQNDPTAVINKMNEAWGLGYLTKEEAEELSAGSSTDDGDTDMFGDIDITQHPAFKQMSETLDKIQSQHDQQVQDDQNAKAIKEFGEMMDGLEAKAKEDNLPFNRMIVTAFMSQGMEADAAIEAYHKELAGQVNVDNTNNQQGSSNSEQTPVMGAAGSVGSGLPDGSVDFGAMSKNDLNSSIENLLQQAESNGQ